jgi:hypothetical protein
VNFVMNENRAAPLFRWAELALSPERADCRILNIDPSASARAGDARCPSADALRRSARRRPRIRVSPVADAVVAPVSAILAALAMTIRGGLHGRR